MTDTPANPLLVPITEQNKYKGALFIEAYDSLIDSIGSGAQDVADTTFNAIGAVASTVSLVVDPFGSLLGAGLGWLMEHISFLREALDQMLGDPEAIQANVDATKAKAVELRVLAEDHRSGLATFDGWTGASSENFQASMDTMGKELDSLANGVETKAKVVSIMGMIVSVVRDLVRDAIAQFVGSVVANAVIGVVGAAFTFGASAGFALAQTVREAVEVAAMIASKVRHVVKALTSLMGKIDDLDGVMTKIGKGWERFDNVADVTEISYEAYKAADTVDDAVDKGLQSAKDAAPAPSGPDDPLQHARDVNKSTGSFDAVKGDAFFGDAGRADGEPDAPTTP